MAGSRRRKNSSTANAICDRSGGKYPMNEMCIEPGTGYLVHVRFSDGRYNLVDHPANHIERYVAFGDPFPVDNARPERSWVLDIYLTDEEGVYVTTETEELILTT